MENEKDEAVIKSLHRIEGQVRGVEKMVESGRSCEDILIQLSAINAAVNSVAKTVMHDHLRHHLVLQTVEGRDGSDVEQLIEMLDNYFKMKK